MTGPAVAALLPVRLETRFIPPGELPERPGVQTEGAPETWRLRLRILPDTISVDTHDPAVSPAEKAALTAFWSSVVSVPDPGDPAASARAVAGEDGYADAFSRLAAQVGPGRAAWLVRAVPAHRPAGAEHVQVGDADPSAVPREGAGVVRGFPRVIEVWALWHGEQAPEVIGSVPVDTAVLETPPRTAEPPDWLVSWERGAQVGTAAEITLPRHPREIAVLGVSGVRDGDDDALAALLAGHAAAGSLSVVGPGEATTAVAGSPVVPTGTEPREWFAPPGEPPRHARSTLEALLGDRAARLGPVPTRGDDALDELLVRLTFPALWGYGMTEVLGLVDRLELAPLWQWAARWLRPQGCFGTLLVDGTAYGVLPVVDPGSLAEHSEAGDLPVRPLLRPLAASVRAWAAAAAGEQGAAGGGVEDVVRVLRRGPVPGDIGRASCLRAELVDVLTGTGPQAAYERWDTEHEPALRVLDDAAPASFDGLRYLARSPRVDRLSIPLIVGSSPSADDAVNALVEALEHWRHDLVSGAVDFGIGAGEVQCIYANLDPLTSSFYLDRTHPDSLLARLLMRSVALAGGSLDLWRQELGRFPLVNDPEPPRRLGEFLVLPGDSTMVRLHLNALRQTVHHHGGEWVGEDPRALALAEELTWLTGAGTDGLHDLLWEVVGDASRSREAHRAMRALLECAGSRWDVWWHGLGAAHLHDVQSVLPGAPAAGVYGWVDQPWRGSPGPGPGGLLMAPSLVQATTAAALRDRAVHDPEHRWDLRVDSATVGPARSLLADIADGWHPAEVVGRLLEEAAERYATDADVALGAADFVPLREAFPLRTDQGHFGCCHGLDVLAQPVDALPVLPRAPGALPRAVEQVSAVVATASDLLLAEAVHGVLAGRPERAAVATEFLAGQAPPGDLTVLDPVHGGRSVRTLVLAALPDVAAPEDATGILAAAAGFDAAVRASAPEAAWEVALPGTDEAVPLAALGLAPVHTAVLDDAALTRLALLHAGRAPQPAAPPPVPVDGAAVARLLASAFGGAAPDPADLQPPALRSGELDDTVLVSRQAALESWRSRTETLGAAAELLAASVAGVATAAREAWSLEAGRTRAQENADEPPEEPEEAVPAPTAEELVGHVLALAAWGFGPPAGTEDLHSVDPDRSADALQVTMDHLGAAAAGLAARAATARIASGEGPVDATVPTAVHRSAAGASTLAELVAGRALPIGTPAPTSLLAEPLALAAGTGLLSDWLPTVARVRPRLERLVPALDGAGLTVAAVDPADPWRLTQLESLPTDAPLELRLAAEPRLTVLVGPDPLGGDAHEFVVVDAFAERVPDPEQHLGLAFDAATPSAVPPQAVLLVPSTDPAVALTAADLPAAVLLARAMGHARMATTVRLAADRLGPLATACLLPQDGDTGCPLGDPHHLPAHDLPAALVPLPTHQDTEDVVAAVTADPSWMLGVQCRLGEHAGEDAASPVLLASAVTHEAIPEPLLAHRAGEAVVEASGWRPDRLRHAMRWSAPETSTVVDRHDAGRLDWWAMTSERVSAPTDVEPQQSRGFPTAIDWPGQPRRRYWEVEEAAADAIGRGPDRAHPASLHLVDVLSRLGDTWYLVPLPGTAGSFTRVHRATMTDAAGGTWLLRTDPRWSLFAVAGADPEPADALDPEPFHRALPVILGAGAALEGEPVEDVAFAVDEDANLVWTALRRGSGLALEPEPGAVTVLPRRRALGSEPKEVRWQLGGEPPVNRLAYLYGGMVQAGEFGYGRDLFVQARIRDPRTGELPEPPEVGVFQPGSAAAADGSVPPGAPHTLWPLALPASGVRLLRRHMLARDVHGAPVRWQRTERRPLDVTVDVHLAWDALTET